MSQDRIQMNATLLPDGRVLARGGSINNEDPNTASLAADLFDPVAETWAPAGVEAPDGLITLLAADLTIHAGEAVNFRASVHDPDGTIASYAWIFPDREPGTSTARNPASVTFEEPGIHVVSMTAIDNLGVNDPSPPTARSWLSRRASDATPARP